MTIDEELSIIRDNIAEYGQTNITQEEYNMIYNKAIDDLDAILVDELEKSKNPYERWTLNHILEVIHELWKE